MKNPMEQPSDPTTITTPHAELANTGVPADVYRLLAEHQVTGTDGWALEWLNGQGVQSLGLKKVMENLHEWAERFRSHFKLGIPSVPLRLAKLRRNCLGHFNPAFNDFGLVNEIAVDLAHLVRSSTTGEWWRVLATLCHEQLHFWQQVHGKPSKPGPFNYHNVQYRTKAAYLGLIVSDRGVNVDYIADGRFLTLLQEHGVKVPKIVTGPPLKALGKSTLQKWSCRCNPPVNVRLGRKEFRARCHDCGHDFARAAD